MEWGECHIHRLWMFFESNADLASRLDDRFDFNCKFSLAISLPSGLGAYTLRGDAMHGAHGRQCHLEAERCTAPPPLGLRVSRANPPTKTSAPAPDSPSRQSTSLGLFAGEWVRGTECILSIPAVPVLRSLPPKPSLHSAVGLCARL